MPSSAKISYVVADEAELSQLAEGRLAGSPVSWKNEPIYPRLQPGQVGALCREPKRAGQPVRPLLLVVKQDDTRRLYGRFSQLRSDLSPLSSWCHIMTPDRFSQLDGLSRCVELSGTEAAWIGLAIAEASLLAERPVPRLRLAACLATQTFAVARCIGLWPRTTISEISQRYDSAQQLLRTAEPRAARLRNSFEPLWKSLIALSGSDGFLRFGEERAIVEALRALRDSREKKSADSEALVLHSALREFPEADVLQALPAMTPEDRVKVFDLLVTELEKDSGSHAAARQTILTFLVGYLATIVAGGAPSLAMAEVISKRWPEVTAWAYVIGSLGEQVIWTSSFDGLGRLVGRELMRPLRFDEAPQCDFALDEAEVLVDKQLADPLVHLRIKQLRVISVALFPGVNLSLPFLETSQDTHVQSRYEHTRLESGRENQLMELLAEAMLPYIRSMLREDNSLGKSSRKTTRKGPKKGSPQSKLPLK